MVSRTVEIGGAGCEVEIEAVVVAVVSGEGFGMSLPGRDLGGGGSSPKMHFFDRVGVCICGGRKGEKAREREREKKESMVRKREGIH